MGKNRASNLPTMGEDTSGTIFNKEISNPNPETTVTVGDKQIELPRGFTKDRLDNQLMRTMLKDVVRNSITGEVGYMSGNPKADLYELYESPYYPWNQSFPNYGDFERYYEENVRPKMLEQRQAMMDYLKEHEDRDLVSAFNWLNGDYE